MKIVIIGAVAAGTSAAAKASRNDPAARITIYEKDQDISYAGCFLPYYIGGEAGLPSITPRDSAYFKKQYGVNVLTRHEVKGIDRANKRVTVVNLENGNVFEDSYDKLIIASGARSVVPPITGAVQKHVFTLRSVRDAVKITEYIESRKPRTAVIAGSGALGLEMLENLKNIETTVVEAGEQIVPALDADMAEFLEDTLRSRGINIMVSRRIDRISEAGVTLNGGQTLDADIVLLTAGVRPNSELAADAGLEIGFRGAIKVNQSMLTSDENIYACGDCTETFSSITGFPAYFPLGSTANKTGRIAGDAATGGGEKYRGSLGSGIFRVFDIAVGFTGLGDRGAREAGFDPVSIRIKALDKSEIFNGHLMEIKVTADRITHRLLGAQIIGASGVDKRIDVFACMITRGAAAEDLEHIDLCYSPPFSSARDPVHISGMVLSGALNK